LSQGAINNRGKGVHTHRRDRQAVDSFLNQALDFGDLFFRVGTNWPDHLDVGFKVGCRLLNTFFNERSELVGDIVVRNSDDGTRFLRDPFLNRARKRERAALFGLRLSGQEGTKQGQQQPPATLVFSNFDVHRGIASFQAPAFGPFIECDSEDNDQTDHRGLPERGDAEKDQTIPEYADDKDSENCSEDGALTARKGCSAYNRNGNYIKLKPDAVRPA
jgi:hypothetical protein